MIPSSTEAAFLQGWATQVQASDAYLRKLIAQSYFLFLKCVNSWEVSQWIVNQTC